MGFGLVGLLVFGPLVVFASFDAWLLAASIAAGVVEGAIVSFAQHRVLRRDFPVRYHEWAIATIVPAMLAYAIGDVAFPFLGERQQWAALGALGVGLAALLGAGQWLILRRHARRAAWWIPASALAWALGIAVAIVAIALVPDGAPPWAFALAAVAGGLGMGALVGVVTGVAYERLLPAT